MTIWSSLWKRQICLRTFKESDCCISAHQNQRNIWYKTRQGIIPHGLRINQVKQTEKGELCSHTSVKSQHRCFLLFAGWSSKTGLRATASWLEGRKFYFMTEIIKQHLYITVEHAAIGAVKLHTNTVNRFTSKVHVIINHLWSLLHCSPQKTILFRPEF